MNMPFLLSLIIFSPLIGIVILSFIRNNDAAKTVGILSTIPAIFLTSFIYFMYQSGESLERFSEKKQWLSFGSFPVHYELAIDEFSLIMLMLTSVLALCSSIASIYIKTGLRAYFMLFLLLEIGMLGVFLAQNLILFFLFFEITLIPLFFLIGKWGYRKKEETAFYFLIYNGLGSAVLLIAISVLFAKTGTVNITDLKEIMAGTVVSEELKLGLLVSLLIAFGVKLPIFPLHSWVIKVHSEAPIPVVMLHSGILLKIGAYGLIRFGIGLFPNEFEKLSMMIMILGLINLLYGAFLALIVKEFKKVLAYASISHMGIILLGLGALNEAGVQGAIFQVVSHGIISALFFFLVGIIADRTGRTDLTNISGLAKGMPIAAGCLLMAAMASLALPGTSGFISEFTVFLGVFKAMPVIASIGVIAIILTAAYVLQAVLNITFGKGSSLKDVRTFEFMPILLLIGIIIGIGIYPNSLAKPLQQTVETITKSLEADK
ncbi:NADH-quinone oxidoreductase subunit M [Metabacillus fastidiosus]|uniref:complex I subunit 4 family protein n=1 Tax=Metabacillus fastidiosus TaxID=1458 RepID=UPI002E20BCC7|nr:NADH-quinone oxidoreductase subunit M [Metabacillus fastidiosus]